jgi:hypothetical protein
VHGRDGGVPRGASLIATTWTGREQTSSLE